jgi:NADPH:quinone reductase-like Zn-dependent oxidoreductase
MRPLLNGTFVDMSQATSQGALSEYIRVRADHVAKKPKNIGAVEAAGIATTALTAWQMLFKHAQIKEGDHIFVNGGTTSVGMWAIQIAKANGCRVTATTSGKNYEWLKETFRVDTVRSISPLIPYALTIMTIGY